MKPGDLLIVQRHHLGALIGQPQWEIVEVAAIGRSGQPTRYRPLDVGGPVPMSVLGYILDLVRIPADRIDKPALVAAARAHTWPTAPHSRLIMPWSSADEVRDLIRRHTRPAQAALFDLGGGRLA